MESKPSDSSLVEEAIQYANRATVQLKSPTDEDALKRGLDDLHKSVWVLPLHGHTNKCWLGLHDNLDQMTTKAAVTFRREQRLEERRWKAGKRNKDYLYCDDGLN